MRLKPRQAYFLAFTGIFSVLAIFVFWGTWSPDACPIMPDCTTIFPMGYFPALSRLLGEQCLSTWQVIPDDLLLFFGTPYFRQEFQYALAAYFAALGLVYYLRGRGLCRAAAYGAGLLLAFCGYWFTLFSAGHLGWFKWMTYGVFAFGLCDRAVRKGKLRHWLLLAAVLAWSAKHQQDLWLMFTLFTAAYFAWCCIRERRLPKWKGAAIALAAFFVIGGANIRSAFSGALASRQDDIRRDHENASALTGGEGRSDEEAKWIFTTNWSMPPEDTLEFFLPRINGDTSCPFVLSLGIKNSTGVKPYTGRLGRPIDATAGNYRQHSLYVGAVTCLFALAAIVLAFMRRLSGRDFIFFAAAALLFWLLSMGRYCECVYRAIFNIPLLSFIRAPVKWHHLTEFCIVVMAAYGIDALWRLPVSKAKRFMRPLIVAFVVIGACDLCRIDRLYCASVDLRECRRRDMHMDLTFLGEQDLRRPQVAAMVRSRRIIPLANYLGRSDVYLVEALSPRKPPATPRPVPAYAKFLGVLALAASVFTIGYSLRDVLAKKNKGE